jgi:hypothetical protein
VQSQEALADERDLNKALQGDRARLEQELDDKAEVIEHLMQQKVRELLLLLP